MNNLPSFEKILPLADRFNTAPAGEIATAILKEDSSNFPRVFCKIESALSCLTSAVTAPFHVIKDLILAASAVPLAPSSPSAKKFATHRLTSAGLDAAAVFGGIFGLAYPFTPLPSYLKKQLPQPLSSTAAMAQFIQKQTNKISKSFGGKEKVLKTAEWLEKNSVLSQKIVQEIPALKPIVPLIPHAKKALDEVFSLSNNEKIVEIITTAEKMNHPSFVGLILASAKNHSKDHGKKFAKIDSASAYGMVALTTPFHVITQLFMIAVSAPFAPFSKKSKAFCLSQIFKAKLSLACFLIGLKGMINPEKAEKILIEKSLSVLPEKWQILAKDLSDPISKMTMQDISEVQKFFTEDKRTLINTLLPKLANISKEHPDCFERIAELAEILDIELPKNMTKIAAPLLAEIATLEQKHPGLTQEIANLAATKDFSAIAQQLPKLCQEHPGLVKDIAQTIQDKPEIVEALAEIPAIKDAIPEEAKKHLPSIVKDVVAMTKDHPKLVTELPLFQPDNKKDLLENLEEIAKKNPGLDQQIEQLKDKYPELDKNYASNLLVKNPNLVNLIPKGETLKQMGLKVPFEGLPIPKNLKTKF